MLEHAVSPDFSERASRGILGVNISTNNDAKHPQHTFDLREPRRIALLYGAACRLQPRLITCKRCIRKAAALTSRPPAKLIARDFLSSCSLGINTCVIETCLTSCTTFSLTCSRTQRLHVACVLFCGTFLDIGAADKN